jgi:hypothetical protein
MKTSHRCMPILILLMIVIAFACGGCAGSEADLLLRLKTVEDTSARQKAAADLARRHSLAATQDLVAAAGGNTVATAGLAALRDEYIATLGSTDPWAWTESFTTTQAGILDCLAAVGDSVAAKALREFALAPDLGPQEVRLKALQTLGSFDEATAVPQLVEAIIHQTTEDVVDHTMDDAVVACLVARPGFAAAPLVEAIQRERLYDGGYETWQTLQHALVALGGPAAEAVAPFVGQDWADSVLHDIGIPGVPAIGVVLGGSDSVAAANALALLCQISFEDEAVKSVVVPYLAKPELIPLLLDSPYCRAPDEYVPLSAPVFGSAIELALLQIGQPAVSELVDRGVGLLNETAEWADTASAGVIYQLIAQYPAAMVTQVLVEKVTEGADDRLRTLFLAVKLGTAGSQEALIQALDDYGDKIMAEDYLNCGSAELSEAAERWAKNHGYYVASNGGGSHRGRWGAF